MKKFLFILLIISSLSVKAQQAIEIDPRAVTVPRYPDATAIDAIASPKTGMMVYNIATQTNWTYNGNSWINAAGAGASQWVSSGSNIVYGQTVASSNSGTFSNTTTYPIPDAIASGITSTVNVTLSNQIINPALVTISINLEHTWAGDIKVDLVSPNGTIITLINQIGLTSELSQGWNENFISSNTLIFNSQASGQIIRTFPYSTNNPISGGTFLPSNGGGTQPVGDLASLLNENVNGIWSLIVSDWFTTDVGNLNSWSITFAPNSTGEYPKVGIGTISPTEKLQVVGKIRTSQLRVDNGAATGKVLTSDAIGNATWETQWTTSGSNIHYSTGNVGIGNTTPNAPLQFSNSLSNRKIVLYDAKNNDHQYYGFGVNPGILRYQTNTTADDHVFYSGVNSTSSNELFRIKGNGNVGIGTNNPTNNLSVNGNSDFTGNVGIGTPTPSELLDVNGKTKTNTFQLSTGAAANYVLVSDVNGNATWQNPTWTQSGTTINYSVGNVGILTGTPTSTLDVNGSMATKMIKINTFTNVYLDETGSIWYFSSNPNVTLPTANTCENRRYVLVNTYSAPINLSIFYLDFNGTQNFTLNSNSSIEIISDGINWLQIK